MITIHTHLPHPFTLKPCSFTEYHKLSQFHYRAGSPGPVAKCFALYYPSTSPLTRTPHLAGIIVYSMPPLNSHLRNLATHRYFLKPPTRTERAILVNRDLRTISRVIIAPQFRSLGLAAAIVRETLPLAGTPFVEASAVMGRFHPFFERAGMTRYDAPPPANKQKLLTFFKKSGISKDMLLDPVSLQRKIETLSPPKRNFLLSQIDRYYIAPRRGVFSSKIRPELDWLLPRLCSHLLTSPTYFLWIKNKDKFLKTRPC
jgi:hypothetical protein